MIGTGHMARILGTLAVEGGNAVEVTGRDPAKAAALARALGRGCCCCGRPSGAGTRP